MRVRRLVVAWLAGLVPAAAIAQPQPEGPRPRPNILWITSEDNGPHLGAYGDRYATTPRLDALAKRGVIYLKAWSNAPVCAPARTAIISGLYPTSTGSEHMRSMARLPAEYRMFPAYLRKLGYYTTNNVKEDYNLEKTSDVWDESSPKAHWRNRREGQPFFAVFNTTVTHESSIRQRPHTPVHDPARVRLPAYHPDAPEVRQDWAQYHDRMTEMDRFVGERLDELKAAGLSENTIVVYFGDHGPGMPRSKRWPYDSGLRVPLIVHVPIGLARLAPEGYSPGARLTRLVSFVDLAPTMLSLAGLEAPAWMQGRAFMGLHPKPGPSHLFGFRGRMDERYDMVRSVRDERYVYVRNFMPHRPYGQFLSYMFETPTTRVWKQLYEAGRLEGAKRAFWEPKPFEELYDLQTDPDEVNNLAASAAHAAVRDRFQRALAQHLRETRDLGFLPEYDMRRRAGMDPPLEMGRDPERYPADRVIGAAERATDLSLTAEAIRPLLEDGDPAVRYWGAIGTRLRGAAAVTAAAGALERLVREEEPGPAIAAAEALGLFGSDAQRAAARERLLALANVERSPFYAALLALNALNHLGDAPAETKTALRALPTTHPSIHQRESAYLGQLVNAILHDLR